MREETQPPICAICKQPITDKQRPFARTKSDEPAHLDHMNDDQKKAGS